eukprot:jgi/Psemu1/24554/gm1.24554_g
MAKWQSADPGDQFPVLPPRDLDKCLIDDKRMADDDSQRFKNPRDGDHLMKTCIQRATLDTFWSQERSTVSHNQREVAGYFDCQAKLRTKGSSGMQVACAMLLRSQEPGHNTQCVQFEATRKCHSGFTSFVHTCPDGAGAHFNLQGRGSGFVSTSVTNSLWFKHFTARCHRWMGDVSLPDAPVTLKIMDATLDHMEEKCQSMTAWAKWEKFNFACCAVMFLSGFYGPRQHLLHPINIGWYFQKPNIVDVFTQPLAPKTKKGRDILEWFDRMRLVGVNADITTRSLFMSEDQDWCATIVNLDRPSHDMLRKVQCWHPSLIETGKRRYICATSAAQNTRVDVNTINTNNHWRASASSTRTGSHRSMLHCYSNTNTMIPKLIWFSYKTGDTWRMVDHFIFYKASL